MEERPGFGHALRQLVVRAGSLQPPLLRRPGFGHALRQLVATPSRVAAVTAASALLAAGLTVIAFEGGDTLRAGEARLVPDGEVLVSVGGAGFEATTEERVLARGDRVWIRAGRARIELPGGAAAEGRAGSRLTVGGAAGATLRLERGDLLVAVRRGTVVVDGGSAGATVGAGAVKLRRSASLVAGTYEGRLLLAGTGRSLTVPALRQAAVAGQGRVPDDVRPLELSEDDEWDRRFLGPVLELDRRLVAFGRGFEALLPPAAAVTPSLYRTLLPALAAEPLTVAMLEGRSAGENLIGLSIVSLAQGAFKARMRAVFGFREEGARWGLVAADQGLVPGRVVDTVEAAIDRAPLQLAVPSPSPGQAGGPAPATPTTTSPGGPPPSGGTTTTVRGVTTTTSPPTTGGPTTTQPPTTTTTACGVLQQLLGLC